MLDIILYNAVIDACTQSGDTEKAAEWLSKMLEARLNEHPSVTGFSVDVVQCPLRYDI